MDVQSIYTPSQIQDWYREDKVWARKDRRYSLRLQIPWSRNTKLRTSLTWPNHVLHGTNRKRGKDTKTRCIGSIYSLLDGKDWSSIKQDRIPAHCISKSIVLKSEEIIYQKVYVSPRRPPKISCQDNWMCDLDSDVAGKQQRHPTNRTKTQNPIIKYGETRMWRERGNRVTCHVWSRHSESRDTWWSHRPKKYGETRRRTRIHKTLRVDTKTCWRWSNRYGETRVGGPRRGAQDWY